MLGVTPLSGGARDLVQSEDSSFIYLTGLLGGVNETSGIKTA